VNRPIGKPASEEDVAECRKILRRAGNTISGQNAVIPSSDMLVQFQEVLMTMIMDSTESRHLIAETKQSRLI
jgi:hypothetical protein